MASTSPKENLPNVSVVNVPNALTILRLLLVPVFVWLLVVNTDLARWWSVGVFCVAAATDHLDGQIARAKNLITDFGRLADPIADKALTLGAFVMLSILGLLPWWFTVIVAIRELGITVLREVLRRQGTVVAASSGGKLKTVLQMLLIFVLLIPWESFAPPVLLSAVTVVVWIVLFAAFVVTVWSGAQYCYMAMRR